MSLNTTLKTLLISSGIFITPMAMAEELDCNKLSDCLEQMGEIKKQTYLTQEKVDKDNFQKVRISGTVEELDQAFSFILHQNGLTRISADFNQVYIIPSRDVRYLPAPLLPSKDLTNIPKTYDYFMVELKMKTKEVTHEAVKSLRPFMSRYGRIIHNKLAGNVVIQETGANLHRLLPLLKSFDIKLTADQIKELTRTIPLPSTPKGGEPNTNNSGLSKKGRGFDRDH